MTKETSANSRGHLHRLVQGTPGADGGDLGEPFGKERSSGGEVGSGPGGGRSLGRQGRGGQAGELAAGSPRGVHGIGRVGRALHCSVPPSNAEHLLCGRQTTVTEVRGAIKAAEDTRRKTGPLGSWRGWEACWLEGELRKGLPAKVPSEQSAEEHGGALRMAMDGTGLSRGHGRHQGPSERARLVFGEQRGSQHDRRQQITGGGGVGCGETGRLCWGPDVDSE